MIKFSPLAMQGKNLLLCRAEYFSFYIYIAYPPGKGVSFSVSCPCTRWLLGLVFPGEGIFLPIKYCTRTSAVLP